MFYCLPSAGREGWKQVLGENHHSALVKALLSALDRFMLIDVGCSGGISSLWRQFGDRLHAHGFDPLIAEVERLNKTESAGQVYYHAALVTCRDEEILAGRHATGMPNTANFERTSAVRAAKAAQVDYVRENFNAGAAVVYSDKEVTIDEFCVQQGLDSVDFMKTDTDGSDYYVLRGAQKTLTERGVLGAAVECPLHGTPHLHANTFANIDRYMRECGFALHDLNVWRYSRGALPAHFTYAIPAQTVAGPVQWCDALYLLDPISRPRLFHSLSSSQMLKLLMLYDVFGLPDCAAELLLALRDRGVDIGIDYDPLLNLIAPGGDYAACVAAFDRDPSLLYPRSRA